MYRFIQNIGDYFNPGYFTEDFKTNVFTTSGYDNDAIKEFNKRFSGLRQKYFDYKQKVIEPTLPMKYVLKHTHDFHTALLQALGYDTSEPYSQWLYFDDNRVVPVRHILKNGSQPQLLIMEMQPMIQRGDTKTEGLFEQQYSLPTDQDVEPARYRWKNWNLVDKNPIPEGCTISPKVINQAIEEIFYLPEDQRPRYVLMLAGNYVYMLEQKQFVRGSYLVFDLEELFAEVSIPANRDYYALFYLLCCKQSLAAEGQSALMDKLEEESTKNAFSVTKDLKEGVIHAIEALGNEAVYYIHEVQQRDIDETDDTFEQSVKDDCITIVYRLLFIFYAEARPELGILPMDNPVYVNGYSLDKFRDLETADMQKPATQNGYFIHDSIWRLFSMIHNGYNESLINKTKEAKDNDDVPLSRTFAVKKIDSPLFRDESLKILRGVKYRNVVWQSIICELSITKPDSMHNTVGRISYANLGINQLGSVYESLLAFRGFYAEQNYMEVFKAGEEDEGTYLVPTSRADDFHEDEKKYNPDGSLFTIPKGTFIYRLNGRDRKKSASYYTPEVLTQSTVKYTLKGFVDRLKDPNDSFCAQDLLKLKILEPAMGAAAFQNEAINQLAELYITYREKELSKHVSPISRRDEIQRVKAYIATHNVYGVDLNPTAIELGKLSLWLNVIHRDMETPFFSNRLAVGNAVLGTWLKVYSRDEVIAEKGHKNGKDILLPNAWWEKAPHKVKFFKNRVNRSVNDVYHFLFPDKNMLGVLKIAEQKKAHPDEVKHMNKIMKDWVAPISETEFHKLQRLSDKIDVLLKEYFNFQQNIEALTDNKTELWGIYGQTAIQYDKAENYAEKERLNDTRYRHDNAYFRLKMVMDYWCALWFWDYAHADELPNRTEYWNDIEAMLNVSDDAINKRTKRALKTYVDSKGQVGLFPEYHENDIFYKQQLDAYASEEEPVNARQDEEESQVIIKSKEEILTETQGKNRLIFNDSKHFKYVKELSDRYHFFHPMLEFIEVFWLRDGFDIILGNPPWIKLEFDEADIIAEKFPEVVIRKTPAAVVNAHKKEYFTDLDLFRQYKEEQTEHFCSSAFLNGYSNYPLLLGQQTNLYKCVIENGFSELSENGYMGLLHPEGLYDDPNGQPLRKYLYHRLRYHFQYLNEYLLFAEIGHRKTYGTNIYGRYEQISFDNINNLFVPQTIDECYASDGRGFCGGIKENGTWNIKGHKDRIVHYTEKELKILNETFEDGINPEGTKLVSVQSSETISILKHLALFSSHVKGTEHIIAECFHEANDAKAGKIVRRTQYPDYNKYEMIYSGPHIFVGNPMYKTPRKVSIQKADYDVIDLTKIDEDYMPRTNYVPLLDTKDFCNLIPGFEVRNPDGTTYNERWMDYYRVATRKMLNVEGERTLTPAIIPPKTSHINGLVSTTFKDQNDIVEFSAMTESIVLDFYLKTIGARNLSASRIESFPLGVDDKYKSALAVRTLLLNCLNIHYKKLWEDSWSETFKEEQWSKEDMRLKPFKELRRSWTYRTPLRTYYARHQALLEIDVIVAMALGLSLKDLEFIYKTQFPVFKQYEENTWYDRKGNIVFTKSKGLVGIGVDSNTWEDIKSLKEGRSYKRVVDNVELYMGQEIEYHAPYDCPDRIADYRRAWSFFEKKFNNK